MHNPDIVGAGGGPKQLDSHAAHIGLEIGHKLFPGTPRDASNGLRHDTCLSAPSIDEDATHFCQKIRAARRPPHFNVFVVRANVLQFFATVIDRPTDPNCCLSSRNHLS